MDDKFNGVANIHQIVGVSVGVGGAGVEVCVRATVLVETEIVAGAHVTKIKPTTNTVMITDIIFISVDYLQEAAQLLITRIV
jgi:hypothetical protein